MESRADHDVGVGEAVEHPIEIGGIVLAVGVDLGHCLIAVAPGEEERGAHGTPDSHVERQRHHRGARLGGQCGGGIGRAVVHHEDVRVGSVLTNLHDDVGYRPLLVPGRNGHQGASNHGTTVVARRRAAAATPEDWSKAMAGGPR